MKITERRMKIAIRNVEHAKQVQDALFELGCSWSSRGAVYHVTDAKYLFVDENMLGWSNSKDYFESQSNYTEFFLVDGVFSTEKTPTKKFQVAIENELHSVEVQKALFELGYSWASGGTALQYPDSKFLYANPSGMSITRSDTDVADSSMDKRTLENGFFVLATETPPMEKPPIGLRPRKFATQDRMVEVLEAITRYALNGKEAPYEWLEELGQLNAALGME